jgi:hypothetical protein
MFKRIFILFICLLFLLGLGLAAVRAETVVTSGKELPVAIMGFVVEGNERIVLAWQKFEETQANSSVIYQVKRYRLEGETKIEEKSYETKNCWFLDEKLSNEVEYHYSYRVLLASGGREEISQWSKEITLTPSAAREGGPSGFIEKPTIVKRIGRGVIVFP